MATSAATTSPYLRRKPKRALRQLLQVKTHKALDGNGAALYLHADNDGEHQQWYVVALPGNAVQLLHMQSGKALNDQAQLVPASSTDPGQQWWLQDRIGDAFALVNAHTLQRLDGNGQDVYLHSPNDDGYQRWRWGRENPTANWMEELPDKLTLRDICLPGAHDAGMYALDYDRTLLRLTFFQQLAEGMTNRYLSIWNTVWGNEQEGASMKIARKLGLAQRGSIYRQLLAGCRYFDLRPLWDDNKQHCFIRHGAAVGPPLTDIVQDAVRFLAQHPYETVLFNFTHFDQLGGHNDTAPNRAFLNDLYHLVPPKHRLLTPYNQPLTTLPLEDLRGLLVMTVDSDAIYQETQKDNPIKTGHGVGVYRQYGANDTTGLPLFDEYAKAQSVSEMRQDQLTKFRAFGQNSANPQGPRQEQGLFMVNWTLTPEEGVGAATGPSVESYAADARPELPAAFAVGTGDFGQRNAHGRMVNIINLDYVTDTPQVVDLCRNLTLTLNKVQP